MEQAQLVNEFPFIDEVGEFPVVAQNWTPEDQFEDSQAQYFDKEVGVVQDVQAPWVLLEVEKRQAVDCVTCVPAVTQATPPFAAWENEECAVMDTGDTGETDRMRTWWEVVTKSCSAGTDSTPERTSRVKESSTEGIGEQIVDVPMRLTPHERVQRPAARHIVDVPVPQILEGIVEVASLVPQACVQQRMDEQLVDVPIPQHMGDIVEDFEVVSQEQIPQRICGPIVDLPVPQVVKQLIFLPPIMEETFSQMTEITNASEALQVQVRAISNEIHGKTSGSDELVLCCAVPFVVLRTASAEICLLLCCVSSV